jgi:hypothetical protein
MPKYIRTVVRKNNFIPWIHSMLVDETSSILTDVEKQLRLDAINEIENLPGFLNYGTETIGNTQIFYIEFDTVQNLNDFVGKVKNVGGSNYDPTLYASMYQELISEKIKSLGLSDAYTVSASLDLSS